MQGAVGPSHSLRLVVGGCGEWSIANVEERLSIVNAQAPQSFPFELRGKAEIAKHLRAVYGQEASHRVERGVVCNDRVTFLEACEYRDGARAVVETTLEVIGGKIVRQVDVVGKDIRTDREVETDRKTNPEPNRR